MAVEFIVPPQGRSGDIVTLYVGYVPGRKKPMIGFEKQAVFTPVATVKPEHLDALVQVLEDMAASSGSNRIEV